MREDFVSKLAQEDAAIDKAISDLFLTDLTLDCQGQQSTFQLWKETFWENFEGHLNALAEEHESVNDEIDAMNKGKREYDADLQTALVQRREDIVTGGKVRVRGSARRHSSQHCPYALDQWLATRGFMPGYAFGGDYIMVQFPDSDDDFVREPQRALREFGPKANCYAHKRRWRVESVVVGKEDLREFKRCECGRIYEVTASTPPRCGCGKDLDAPIVAMKMPSVRVKSENRISRWEEIRQSRAFVIEEMATMPPPASQQLYQQEDGWKLMLAFRPKTTVTMINFRSRFASSEGAGAERVSASLEHKPGFAVEGGIWELRGASSAKPEDAYRAIYASGIHDALYLSLAGCETETAEAFRVTLRTALILGLSLALRQGPSEIRGCDLPSSDPTQPELLFYEATVGSAGALARVLEGDTIRDTVNFALEAMHFTDQGEDMLPECKTACYECLQDFFNQREHRFLNRHLVKDFLLWLRDASPVPVDLDSWQDIIQSLHGPGAGNEQRFLELLRDNGLPKPTRQHYALPEDGDPIAEIDFQIGRVHVLVDGSVHHVKWVQEVDAAKRDALHLEGYTLLEFDVRKPVEGIQRLKSLL
jgi:hypothetical protein